MRPIYPIGRISAQAGHTGETRWATFLLDACSVNNANWYLFFKETSSTGVVAHYSGPRVHVAGKECICKAALADQVASRSGRRLLVGMTATGLGRCRLGGWNTAAGALLGGCFE